MSILRGATVIALVLFVSANGGYRSRLVSMLNRNQIQSKLFEPCMGKGECFSGAWMGNIAHLLDNPKLDEFFPNGEIDKDTRSVRCEDASFFFFHKMLDIRRTEKWGEPPIQTIDLFDFSVLHLSSTERLLYKTLNRSKEAKDLLEREMNHTLRSLSVYFNPHAEGNIRRMAMEGKSTALASSAISYNFKNNRRSLQELADRTLVVIPFLLSSKGESGTMKTYRKKNLKLCFWSIFPLFRNIIGAVVNDRDREQALRILPFSRVIKIPEVTVTGMCGLPMAALLQIRREMLINTTMRDSFDFIYYTEGDQVLFARKLPDIFSYLTTHQYTALSPHRLVVPSELVLQSFGRNLTEMINIGGSHSRFSCCLDTSSLAVTRVHWKPISSPSATVIKIFGVPVVAGNGNFFTQEYRVCNISHRVNHCPKNVNSATFLMYDEDPPIFIKVLC